MAKLTLSDITNIFTAAFTLNSNNDKIEAALEKTLSRDGTAPNAMGANLDMNNNRVINLPAPVSASEPARLSELNDLIIASSNGIIATQAEAIAGTDNVKVMSPLRTKESVVANAKDGSWLPVGTGAVATTLAGKNKERLSVLDFMSDALKAKVSLWTATAADAPAIEAAITAALAEAGGDTAPQGRKLVFPQGRYMVRSMVWTGRSYDIEFEGRAQIYGCSTTAVDACIRLHNFRHWTISRMEVETDGTVAAPLYRNNYGCAIQFTSDNGSNPTQWGLLDQPYIRYFKAGIVHGTLLGQSAQAAYPQSELVIRGYKIRGVLQAFYGNANNGYITFENCILARFRAESHANGWDASQGFLLRNDVGSIVYLAGELQTSESGGYDIYGKNMKILGSVYEHSVTTYITGDVTIAHTIDNFYGSGNNPIVIEPGSVGELRLIGFDQRRPSTVGSGNRSLYANCKGSNDFTIVFDNCYLKNFVYTTNNASAHFVLGGKVRFRNTRIDNSEISMPSWYFNDEDNRFITADNTGLSIAATTPALAAAGGWTSSGTVTGGHCKYTASLPTGASSAIRVLSTDASVTVVSPGTTSGSKVSGNQQRDRIITFKLKRIATMAGNFSVQAVWTDFAGGAITGGTETVYFANQSRMDTDGFNEWQQVRCPSKPPSGAVNLRLALIASSAGCDVAITDIEII